MKYFKILKQTFWDWWDNISYSLLTSILGSCNPFFIIILAAFRWSFSDDFTFLLQYGKEFFVVLMTSLIIIPIFPTTIAAYSLQNKIIDLKLENFFVQFWRELKKYLGRGLLFTLINGIVGFLLSYSIIFYSDFLKDWYPFNYILIGLSALFIFLILLSQFIMLPLVVKDDYPVLEYYVISFYMTLKNGLLLLALFLFQSIMVFIFFIPVIVPFLTIIPIVVYFGFVSTFHIWAFKYIDGEVDVSVPLRKRKIREIFSPFAGIRKNRKKDNK